MSGQTSWGMANPDVNRTLVWPAESRRLNQLVARVAARPLTAGTAARPTPDS